MVHLFWSRISGSCVGVGPSAIATAALGYRRLWTALDSTHSPQLQTSNNWNIWSHRKLSGYWCRAVYDDVLTKRRRPLSAGAGVRHSQAFQALLLTTFTETSSLPSTMRDRFSNRTFVYAHRHPLQTVPSCERPAASSNKRSKT